jgi:Secretion system C-terminal sorting domain
MKQYFFLIFIVTTGVASGQPYESMFGNTSTMWIIKWYNLDFGGNDTIVVEKDTLAYGFNWKKIIKTNSYGFFESGALLREDTLIGKVWYRPLEPGWDTTYLAFDFDLEEGDTFDLSSNYDPWLTSVLVDSTDITDTGKRIRFYSFIEQGENITFIEGVGGNQGPIYKESSGLLQPYLLCAYKDGVQTYSNISYEGNCSPPTSINLIEPAKAIEVYPNPVVDMLNIKNVSEIEFEKVEIYDALGRQISAELYHSYIDFNGLSPGLYYLKLVTSKGQIICKSVLHQ